MLGIRNILLIVLAIALVAIVEAVVNRTRLRYRIALARRIPPVDPETGLLPRSSFEVRAAAEIGRSRRFGTTTQIELVAVLDGDVAGYGQALNAALAFPEVGVRIADAAICIIRPGVDGGQVHDSQSIARAQGTVIATGTAQFPVDGDDAASLLRVATERIGAAP